jgi:peptidoglycan/LPS O-acetylase OafA/YrhL
MNNNDKFYPSFNTSKNQIDHSLEDGIRFPHLDALRAIAIIIVLLFHLEVPGFQFGYLGVDLFFMLSGFLMTYTMLIDRQKYGVFRIIPFFIRRFQRLIPSLTITIFVTGIIAIIMMSPEHLKDHAKEGFYSQIFLSNFLFYEQAGYFAPENIVRPLLHTWSLSVEEQYYLLFGGLLILGNRLNFTVICLALSVLGLILLFISYWSVLNSNDMFGLFKNPENVETALFYLMPFRLVQFLAGGLIALAKFYGYFAIKTKVLDFLGLLFLIMGCILLYNASLAQTLSSALAIASFGFLTFGNSYLSFLAGHMTIRFVAKISYQIYLVHWPIIVFWQYWTFEKLSFFEMCIIFILSILLGWILFLLSQRITSAKFFPRRTIGIILPAFFACLIIQTISYSSNGAEWRIPEARKLQTPKELRSIESRYCNGTNIIKGREIGNRSSDPLVTCERRRLGKKTIYVVGDSHARHLLPGLSETFPNITVSVMYFTSCLAQSGIHDWVYEYEGRRALAKACVQRNQKALEFFRNEPATTIILHQYSGYQNDSSEKWYRAADILVTELENIGHNIIWIGSVLRPNVLLTDCVAVPNIFSDSQLIKRCQGDKKIAQSIYEKNLTLARRFPNNYININNFFCPNNHISSCSPYKLGSPLFRDKHHLTPQASIKLIEVYKSKIEAMLFR